MVKYFIDENNEEDKKLIKQKFESFDVEFGVDVYQYVTLDEYNRQLQNQKSLFTLLGGFFLISSFMFFGASESIAATMSRTTNGSQTITIEDMLETSSLLKTNQKKIERFCRIILKTNDSEIINPIIKKLEKLDYIYSLSPSKIQKMKVFDEAKAQQIFQHNLKVFSIIQSLQEYSKCLNLDYNQFISYPFGSSINLVFANRSNIQNFASNYLHSNFKANSLGKFSAKNHAPFEVIIGLIAMGWIYEYRHVPKDVYFYFKNKYQKNQERNIIDIPNVDNFLNKNKLENSDRPKLLAIRGGFSNFFDALLGAPKKPFNSLLERRKKKREQQEFNKFLAHFDDLITNKKNQTPTFSVPFLPLSSLSGVAFLLTHLLYTDDYEGITKNSRTKFFKKREAKLAFNKRFSQVLSWLSVNWYYVIIPIILLLIYAYGSRIANLFTDIFEYITEDKQKVKKIKELQDIYRRLHEAERFMKKAQQQQKKLQKLQNLDKEIKAQTIDKTINKTKKNKKL